MSESIFRIGDYITLVPSLNDEYPNRIEIVGFTEAPHALDGNWPVIRYAGKDGVPDEHAMNPGNICGVTNRDLQRDRRRMERGDRVPRGGCLVLTLFGGVFDDLIYHEDHASAVEQWRAFHDLGDEVDYETHDNESDHDCFILDLDSILGRKQPEE